MVTRLIEQELLSQEHDLAAACISANGDRVLEREIDEWQSFDDGVIE